MPFIEQTALAPAGMVPQAEFDLDVTAPAAPASEIFRAAFRRENSIASTALAISGGPMSAPDPTFDPWASIGGYEDFAASFIDANSPEDVAVIKARIDAERRRADVLASGGAMALAAEVTAGLADPINLIPVGGQIIAVGRAGTRMAQGAMRLGAAGAAGAAAQEAILQATQETRTGAESAVNIASAALLTGILGGAVAGYAGRDLQAIAAKVMGETEQIADDVAANVPGGGRNLSAAAADARTLDTETVAGLGGLEKAMAFSSPTLRTQTSPALATRVLAQELAEQPLQTKGNLAGIASPVAAEALIRQYQYPLAKALTQTDDLFVRYRTGKEGGMGTLARIGIGDVFGQTGGKLTYGQFMEEVGKAMRRGDSHAVPEVAEAAKAMRREVFDPLKDAAVRLGLLPEDVNPGTSATYMMRLYNHQKIEANRNEFTSILTDWYAEKQARQADLQPRVQALLDERARIEGDAAPKPAAPLTVKAGRGAPEPSDLKPMDAESENAWRLYELMRDKGDAAEIARRAAQLDALFQRYGFAADPDKAKNIVRDWGANIEANIAARQAGDWSKTVDISETFDPDLRAEFLATRRAAREASGPSDVSARLADLERRLEDAVLEWEGKATRGARRAVDARTDTAGSGAAARAIFDAAEAIAKVNTRLERIELQDVARQTVDRILSTPAGRLPYDQPTSGARVPLRDETPDLRARALKGRVLMIPDERIEAFLENDAGVVARSYVRTMAPDVVLAERGWLNFKEKIGGITEEYERLRQGVTDPKELTRLQKRMDADIRDIEAIYSRLRNTYALPDNPQGLVVRAGRVARDLNYLRLLGGMTLSAIPDMGRAVMVHGFGRVFRDGLAPLVKNMGAARLAAEEVKLSGTALDMVLDTRAMAMADIMDDYGRYSKFERGLQAATSRFGVVTMMAPWNAAMKQFVGIISQTRSLQAIEAMASGKIAPAERARLAQFGIDEEMAGRIGKEWRAHGEKQDGTWWANTEAWTDRGAAETYRAALAKEVDMAVVTPGQEKPLWMSTELGKVIGQFRSFFMSSMQRVTLAGIQRRDMATMQGATLMLGLGAMVYYLRTDSQRLSDDPAVWLREAVDRSGLTGWAFEINNITEKMTRGAVGVSALTGGPTMSRYASRGVLESLLGPTTGIVNDLAQITGAAATGEWTEADTRAARRMFPYQNLLGLKQAIDATEAGVNEALGIPMRAR
jgi:hypothetical protein